MVLRALFKHMDWSVRPEINELIDDVLLCQNRVITVINKHSINNHITEQYISTLSHTMHDCDFCGELFMSSASRRRHRKKVHGTLQCVCRRMFVLTDDMDRHKRDMMSYAKPYQCAVCCLSFNTQEGLEKHGRRFAHNMNISNTRKDAIDDIYNNKVALDKDDKTSSVKIVDETLFKIMSSITTKKDGDLYCPNHVKLGSYPVNTKIGKADEFDTNICLAFAPGEVTVRRGMINYAYLSNSTSMNVKEKLEKTKSFKKVPPGYVIAVVANANIPEQLTYDGQLVPRQVKYDLYDKIKAAVSELHLDHVDLNKNAHGPALTMTIHPTKESNVTHDISVDMTISLGCNEPITGWPRKNTKRAFDEHVIEDVRKTGVHLVPKKDDCWLISYSKAERLIFSNIDAGNGCRKLVYKMLKKYLQNCQSVSSSGLPGISSHILKTQLLWSCEKHLVAGYWDHNNRDRCLIDVMAELETTLLNGKVPDYFNQSLNVLEGKDTVVLREVANYLHDQRQQLQLK